MKPLGFRQVIVEIRTVEMAALATLNTGEQMRIILKPVAVYKDAISPTPLRTWYIRA